MTEWVTGSELGRRVGMTSQGITAAKKAGRITRGKNGKYPAEQSITALESSRAKRAGPGRGGKKAGDDEDPPSLLTWKVKNEREQYLKRRLERLELQGALVRRSVVEHAVAEKAGMVRDQLLQLGQRIGPALAAESDARICASMVRAEIERALVALADLVEVK